MTPINPELLRQRRRQIHMKQLKNKPVAILITENKKQPEEMAGRIVMVETPVSEPFWRFWK